MLFYICYYFFFVSPDAERHKDACPVMALLAFCIKFDISEGRRAALSLSVIQMPYDLNILSGIFQLSLTSFSWFKDFFKKIFFYHMIISDFMSNKSTVFGI